MVNTLLACIVLVVLFEACLDSDLCYIEGPRISLFLLVLLTA